MTMVQNTVHSKKQNLHVLQFNPKVSCKVDHFYQKFSRETEPM